MNLVWTRTWPATFAVSWIWACLLAPRELATLALSMPTRPQSIASYPRRRDNIIACNRTHTPLSCHSRKRRQQVFPWDACEQHEQNAIQRRTVINARSPSFWRGASFRQQQFERFPQ